MNIFIPLDFPPAVPYIDGMKILILILGLPLVVAAQEFTFELQPEAFPIEVDGWEPYCPWAGGLNGTTPELADLDADGDLDYFCSDMRGWVNYFRNSGTATVPDFDFITNFFDSLTHPNALNNGADPCFRDLDGDGDLDVLTAGSYASIYLNQGSPNQPQFSLQVDTLKDITGSPIVATHGELADIDADGDQDLFAGHYNGYLRYYQNVGTAQSYAFQLISSNWFGTYVSSGFNDPCFADLDGDGDLDLLIGAGDGTLKYWRNDGTPQSPNMTLVSSSYLGLDVGDDASPELADVDADGDLDLLVGRNPDEWDSDISPGDVFYLRNDGTATN
ncbi:MAG: hypothetical protein C4524_05570, partial [Candidatus Zixiibacteriota bacterium]